MTEAQRNRLKDIILYILKDFSGGADYIKLYKILYFANKRQLAEIGLPMVYDNFKAWKYGPVPSFTGSAVKHLEDGEQLAYGMACFNGALKVRRNQRVVGLIPPDRNNIPAYSRAILDDCIRRCKNRSSESLSLESHDTAWAEAYYLKGGIYDGKTTIKPYLTAQAGGASDEIIEFVREYYTRDNERYTAYSDDESQAAYEDVCLSLHELLELPDDWDGEDADAINRIAAFNCRRILSMRQSKAEKIKEIYPTPTGNICIDWKGPGGKTSVEVSGSQIAFYHTGSDGQNYDSPIMDASDENYRKLYAYISRTFD